MSNQLQQLQHSLLEWADKASTLGWLSTDKVDGLQQLSTATPGDLFDADNRPLVAALFGGTGVGKSTLLNRLAEDDIARASAARPTSSNITVYVHSSVAVDHLPDDFPMQRMHTAIHHNKRYQSVMWLDMPDFDSVEDGHRELVTQWLPHIDLLVYVVSPERYKDDEGWRLLLERGSKHAWVFVINHWDKGDKRQRADFSSLLNKAGFDQPLIFCTDSSADANNTASNSVDEFSELETTIDSLADAQLVTQLEKRGIVKRVEQLASQASIMQSQLGTSEQLQLCLSNWQQLWATSSPELIVASDYKAQMIAEQFIEPDSSLLSYLPWRKAAKNTNPIKSKEPTALADDLFFSHADGALDTFMQQSSAAGLPYAALQRHLSKLKNHWRESLPKIVNKALAQSLALPGERWQRALHRLLAWLATLLPLAAVAWVAYRVVLIFQTSGSKPENYLGVNFAVHSVMLVGVAWFIPWFLRLRTKPSRQAAALRGLRQGVQHSINQIDVDCQQAIDDFTTERNQLANQLSDVVSGQGSFDDAALPSSLKRMLMNSA
ncbi:MAG: GTPase domain-containing protein [Granulosicoccaceae bacterium]